MSTLQPPLVDAVRREVIHRLGTSYMGRHLHVFETLDSTNRMGRELAEVGAPHGSVVWAWEQTAGRGRRGRIWLTLPGHPLLVSFVLRPRLPVERFPELSLLGGIATARVLRSLQVPALLKWPNDVEIHGHKVAGVLAELVSTPTPAVVLGIGVNLDTEPADFPPDLSATATSVMASTGIRPDRTTLVAALCGELESLLEQIESSPPGLVAALWSSLSDACGQRVRALTDTDSVEGVVEGVDPDGSLRLRTDSGSIVRLLSGEVTRVRRTDRIIQDTPAD